MRAMCLRVGDKRNKDRIFSDKPQVLPHQPILILPQGYFHISAFLRNMPYNLIEQYRVSVALALVLFKEHTLAQQTRCAFV